MRLQGQVHSPFDAHYEHYDEQYSEHYNDTAWWDEQYNEQQYNEQQYNEQQYNEQFNDSGAWRLGRGDKR